MQICTEPELDTVASVTKQAMLSISSSFRLLCAPSRQWTAAESRGPESGWPQNLAAVGRVACDFMLPVPVLVLFEGLSFLLCFFFFSKPLLCGCAGVGFSFLFMQLLGALLRHAPGGRAGEEEGRQDMQRSVRGWCG